MSDGSSKFTSLIALVLVLPLLFLFQNCGSASSQSGGEAGDSEKSAREAYAASNGGYSAVGSGGSGGASGGTFTLPGSGSSGSGSGSSSSSSENPFGPVKSDGSNCFEGTYAIEKVAYESMGGDDFSVGISRKYLPLQEKRNVSNVGTQMNFESAMHGDVETVSCSESFDKLKRYFPSRYFSSGYTCEGNGSNVTTLQCRSGQWFFAGSSCECKRIPTNPVGGGSDR